MVVEGSLRLLIVLGLLGLGRGLSLVHQLSAVLGRLGAPPTLFLRTRTQWRIESTSTSTNTTPTTANETATCTSSMS